MGKGRVFREKSTSSHHTTCHTFKPFPFCPNVLLDHQQLESAVSPKESDDKGEAAGQGNKLCHEIIDMTHDDSSVRYCCCLFTFVARRRGFGICVGVIFMVLLLSRFFSLGCACLLYVTKPTS